MQESGTTALEMGLEEVRLFRLMLVVYCYILVHNASDLKVVYVEGMKTDTYNNSPSPLMPVYPARSSPKPCRFQHSRPFVNTQGCLYCVCVS